ncbi:DeoR/GlpR family DNA-binding transcription regulator, partial [Liquorilactobacillus ghanensis]
LGAEYMIPIKRQAEILKILKEEGFAKYTELSKQIFVSASTIRRDAHDMENRGLVKRVLNGIMLSEEPKDVPYDYSATLNLKEKREIANKASILIKSGMNLFIDSSTTTLVFLRDIQKIENLYIVTNGLITALECCKQATWHVNLLGGNLNKKLKNISGEKAVFDIANYQADLAIFSCRGLIPKGATDANYQESYLKRTFTKHSDKTMLLVDDSKFNKHQMYLSAPMKKIDYIVSNQKLPQAIQNSVLTNDINTDMKAVRSSF